MTPEDLQAIRAAIDRGAAYDAPTVEEAVRVAGRIADALNAGARPDPEDVDRGMLDVLIDCAIFLSRGKHFLAQHLERAAPEPYLEIRPAAQRAHNPAYDQDAECAACGHQYHRHFDWMPGEPDEFALAPVGCKYCACFTFEAQVKEPDGR